MLVAASYIDRDAAKKRPVSVGEKCARLKGLKRRNLAGARFLSNIAIEIASAILAVLARTILAGMLAGMLALLTRLLTAAALLLAGLLSPVRAILLLLLLTRFLVLILILLLVAIRILLVHGVTLLHEASLPSRKRLSTGFVPRKWYKIVSRTRSIVDLILFYAICRKPVRNHRSRAFMRRAGHTFL